MGDKGVVTFLGSKIGKHLQFCGRAHYRAIRKNLENRKQLDEPVECASGGDPLLPYKILHLLFFPRPPLWSSGQSFWLQIQRSRVRFPALPDFSE